MRHALLDAWQSLTPQTAFFLKEMTVSNESLKRYLCLGCGFLYDEQLGLPEEGIPAGTRWADIPDDWVCLDCGTPKHRFEMVEIPYADHQPNPVNAFSRAGF
jgi:rubredoxin